MALTHATFAGVVAEAHLGSNIYLGGWLFGLVLVLGILAVRGARGQNLTAAPLRPMPAQCRKGRSGSVDRVDG